MQAVDGGKGGGEQILSVFEKRLTDNIEKLNFSKMLTPVNVKRIVEEADGYQPHLIAPEMGYRRLLMECLVLFKARLSVFLLPNLSFLYLDVSLRWQHSLSTRFCKGRLCHLQIKVGVFPEVSFLNIRNFMFGLYCFEERAHRLGVLLPSSKVSKR